MNQYWYSPHTIETVVNVIESVSTKCAFLSTPSLFYSIKDENLKRRSILFDVCPIILSLRHRP